MLWGTCRNTSLLRYWRRLITDWFTPISPTEFRCKWACANNEFRRAFKNAKSSILAKINKKSCLSGFKKLNVLTSPCLYILEITVFFKSNVPLLEALIYTIIILEAIIILKDYYRTKQHRMVVFFKYSFSGRFSFL